MKLAKTFLIFIFLALVCNAQSPTALSNNTLSGPKYVAFKTITPKEVFGNKGDFILCLNDPKWVDAPCAVCGNKKFQRMYLRYHIGGAHGKSQIK
tara:strand:+ start:591 stop:875 length:285 start_codon:yes stop_codon:yes gene_type:complete